MKKTAGLLAILSVLCLAAPARPAEEAAIYTLSISPAACQLTSKDQSTLTWFCEQDEFYWMTAYPESLWVNVPLQLPHMAVVKGLTVYCTVNGGGSDDELEFYLTRHRFLNGSTQKLSTITTTTLVPSSTRKALSDGSIEYATVDNNNYSYALVIRFRSGSSNLKFHGAKIRYALS